MPFLVAGNQQGGPAYTIPGLINLLNVPVPPTHLPFLNLGPGGVMLGTKQGAQVNVNAPPPLVRSVGLSTCASICFVNTANNQAYVYHANAGHLSQHDFINLMGHLGAPPYGQVFIAYAHLGPTDPGYQSTIQDMVNWGIPGNNIVHITNLDLSNFGLNNQLQLGF